MKTSSPKVTGKVRPPVELSKKSYAQGVFTVLPFWKVLEKVSFTDLDFI